MLTRTKLAIIFLAFFSLSEPANAETDIVPIGPTYLPNFVGIGVGNYPDYFGSDDDTLGGAPFGRVSWGQRYVNFLATFVTANVLDHPNWRVGPTLFWRFGRDDVDDAAVNKLPDIDGTLELGLFAAYEIVSDVDPRNRWRFASGISQDVGNVHEGNTVWGSVQKWVPVGQFGALGISVGSTYGSADYMNTYFSVTRSGSASSGLPVYNAGSGMRDFRASVVFVQPISLQWQLGAGVLYSRLLGDAADSPIVSTSGSRDQFVYGIGISRAF